MFSNFRYVSPISNCASENRFSDAIMLKDHICQNIAFSFVLVADVALVKASWRSCVGKQASS